MNLLPMPRHVPHRMLGVAAVALFLPLLLVSGAQADLRPMHPVFVEDFDDGAADGWSLETYVRGDKLEIIPTVAGYDAAISPRHLRGISPDGRGAGYKAQSPTYEAMGVNPNEPYAMRFHYRIDQESCWTYALASRHVSLVVLECVPGADSAIIGVVDDMTQRVVRLGQISTGVWHQVDILVQPKPGLHVADVDLRIDGVMRANLDNWPAAEFRDRLMMLDLPYRIADVDNPPENAGCFGGGEWDRVEMWVQEPADLPDPRDLEFSLAPNPFNPRTELSFVLGRSEQVRVDVYDVAGRLVRPLFAGVLDPGPQSIVWDGRDARNAVASSGVYLFRVSIGTDTRTVRAVLVR